MSPQAPTQGKLAVRVLAPTKKIYEGPAVTLTAKNKVGQFDILFDHANFFSLLVACQVVVNTGSQNLTFPISEGLIKVKNNNVTLFVDIEPGYQG